MSTAIALPDEQTFRAHINDGPFIAGVDRGRWRLVSIDWPFAIIGVTAATGQNWPSEYVFRFECSNYPQAAVTAQPWDLDQNLPLAFGKWPGGKSRIPAVFRPDWKEGKCLYLPCDRISIEGHEPWRTQHPHLIWKSTSDITLYLEELYDLLNSSDYSGPRGT
jgi:hypothetical protein